MGGDYEHHTLLRADDTLKPVESTLPRQHSRYADAARYSVWNPIPAPQNDSRRSHCLARSLGRRIAGA
jgi:hypothetical protein